MKKLDIIYEDDNLLVVNKPSKLLTISDGVTTNTLYSMAREYVKKKHKSNKIFIVHRLDRDTSGVVLFAKNEALKYYLQNNWNDIAKREYIGILENNLKKDEDVIKVYLREDKTRRVYVSDKGEYALTKYKVIKRCKNTTVVEIEIKTGKKNQIRASFAYLGNPIIGDKKYGSKINPINRLGLHASKLEINIKGHDYTFICKIPKEFDIYLK